MVDIYKWRTEIMRNGRVDPSMPWAQTMPASLLNDSARTMMAHFAQWLNMSHDVFTIKATISDHKTTYFMDSPLQNSEVGQGMTLIVKPDCNNVGAVWLKTQRETWRVYKNVLNGFAPLSDNDLIKDAIFEITMHVFEGGICRWVLTNPATQIEVLHETDPIGSICAFSGQTAPKKWLLCNGAQYDKATFPLLYDAIGTIWGGDAKAAKFNVPDLRSMFLRGASAAVKAGTKQKDAFKKHTHKAIIATSGRHDHFIDRQDSYDNGVNDSGPNTGGLEALSYKSTITSYGGEHSHTATLDNYSGGSETTPKSAAVHFIIRAEL